MLIINFAHPITPAQVQSIEILTGRSVEGVIEQPAHFNAAAPFVEQVVGLVDGVGLSAQAWQTTPLIINLPSLNYIAAAVLAELHGRMGYFPAILRLRQVPDSLPPTYEVAEILNLQAMRDAARGRR